MSEQHERPPIDWKAIADEFAQSSKNFVDDVSNRAKQNAEHAKKGEYDVDKLFDDVEWFWNTVADNLKHGVVCWREKVVRHADGQ